MEPDDTITKVHVSLHLLFEMCCTVMAWVELG